MLTVLDAHLLQIEDAFRNFLTRQYIRPVHDGEELQFGSSSELFVPPRPGTD